MTTVNDITKDKIKTKPTTHDYRDNYDKAFKSVRDRSVARLINRYANE